MTLAGSRKRRSDSSPSITRCPMNLPGSGSGSVFVANCRHGVEDDSDVDAHRQGSERPIVVGLGQRERQRVVGDVERTPTQADA